jgi:hypothetical protein
VVADSITCTLTSTLHVSTRSYIVSVGVIKPTHGSHVVSETNRQMMQQALFQSR